MGFRPLVCFDNPDTTTQQFPLQLYAATLNIRPLFCEGRGPFRWAALSGDPADIAATDAAILDLFPDNEPLARWIRMAREKVHFQGLPARICWLGYGERHLLGSGSTSWSPAETCRPPSVLGRDHRIRPPWPTGKPRRWPTAPTRSPTGRC